MWCAQVCECVSCVCSDVSVCACAYAGVRGVYKLILCVCVSVCVVCTSV